MTALEEYNQSRVTRDYTLADRMRDELLKRAEQAEAELEAADRRQGAHLDEIHRLEEENRRLQVGWDCAELAVFLKNGLLTQANRDLALLQNTDVAKLAVQLGDRAHMAEAENKALHDYAQGELERANKAEARESDLLRIMREGGCRDCDDLSAEVERLKAGLDEIEATISLRARGALIAADETEADNRARKLAYLRCLNDVRHVRAE